MKATNLYTASYKTVKGGVNIKAMCIGGKVDGRGAMLVSLVPYLVNHQLPNVREVRDIIAGKTIESSEAWEEAAQGVTVELRDSIADLRAYMKDSETIGFTHSGTMPGRRKAGYCAQNRAGAVIGWFECPRAAFRAVIVAYAGESHAELCKRAAFNAKVEGDKDRADATLTAIGHKDAPANDYDANIAQLMAWQRKPVSPGDAVVMAAAVMAGVYESHGIGDDCGAVDYVCKMSPEVESPEYLYSMIASWCDLLAELRAIDIDVPALKITFASGVAQEFGAWLYHAIAISGAVPTSDDCEAKIAQLAAGHMCRAGGDLPLALDMVDSVVHPRS